MLFNRILNVGLFFYILFNLLACGSSPSDSSKNSNLVSTSLTIKNSKTHNDGPVVIFGDSIASGQGASSVEKSLFGCMKSLTDKEVIMKAFPGVTSHGMIRAVNEVQPLLPSLVIVSLGGNDVLEHAYSGGFPESKTYESMNNILFRFIYFNSLVVYIGLNPPKSLTSAAGIDASRLLGINKIAIEQGAILIPDGLKGMWGKSEFMADELHPNDKGYALLCKRIKEALKPHYNYVTTN